MAKRKAPKGCFWRDGVLWGRSQVGGVDRKWSLRTDDPAIAKTRRDAERARIVSAVHYGDHRRTFQEALEAWTPYIIREVGQKTVARYASSLAVLQPHLDGLYLDEINTALIGQIVAARRDTPTIPRGKKKPIMVTNATIKRDLTALSSVLDHEIDEGRLKTNPVVEWLQPGSRRRRKSRLAERRDPIVLPELAHVQMVIDAAPGLFRHLIETAVKTGARQEEIGRTLRAHIDRHRRQLTIIGKRNKRRVIDLVDGGDDFGFEILTSVPAAIETNSLFWHRDEQGRVSRFMQISSNFARLVRSVGRQARIQERDFRPFTFHHLRHLHAVLWLKSGRSIYVLQQRLGHTSIKTTEMYLEFLTHEEKQRVMLLTTAGTDSGTGHTVRTA